MRSATATIKRCSWVGVDDLLMLRYHDREWGVPVHDDRKHFEFLVLEAGGKVIGALSMGLIPRKSRDIRFDESRSSH
jgi:3-methyladenine DNA glycosylase Tag